jgi:protoheme IX farnesyltransferase
MKPDVAVYDKPGERTAAHSKLGDILVLAKARLNALVVATTAGGYYMAGPDEVPLGHLLLTCLGTALVASGAGAFNHVQERSTDRLMERTRHRPVADGRMSPGEGVAIALGFSVAGLALLWSVTNLTATTVALVTLLSYNVAYTPLKRHSSLSTVVGAVPGALPPLIGWAAVQGSVSGPGAWSLFVIMFFWQLPHFLAIAWMCRDDYARAGLPMLSVVDPHGAFTGRQATLWAAALVPLGQLPVLFGLTSAVYGVGAAVLGVLQLAMAFRFARHRSTANARALFYASIIYLPLLWLLMVVARQG